MSLITNDTIVHAPFRLYFGLPCIDPRMIQPWMSHWARSQSLSWVLRFSPEDKWLMDFNEAN